MAFTAVLIRRFLLERFLYGEALHLLYDGASQPNNEEKKMSLQEQFDQAVLDSKNLPERPDNMTLLKIYALYKQGSSGDASGERPGMTDFVNRAKFDAWAALQGTSQDEARQQYIDLIEDLKA
jgi:diazepam-binding inhibitor (GABA receptor modulating acyl-CoA-binding protein)